MKRINVKIEITSLDSEIKFEVTGEYKNERIKFVDNEGVTNFIIIQKNALEYYKKGAVDMKYKFDLDAVTKGYYSIMGNKFEFDIVTNEMNVQDDYIYIKYDLYQSNELVNSTELKVEYRVKEELL